MANDIKNRLTLSSYFVTNAIPTASNFKSLIDSSFNQADDGLFREGKNDPLRIVAADGERKQALAFHHKDPRTSDQPDADWVIGLKASDGPEGLDVGDGAGNSRLFIAGQSGRIGIGTNKPGNWAKVVIHSAGVPLAFRETDRPIDQGGLWRLPLDGGDIRFDVNTGPAGSEFGPQNYATVLRIRKGGRVDVGSTIVLNGRDANVLVGGNQKNGDLHVRSDSGQSTAHLAGGSATLRLGGGTVPGKLGVRDGSAGAGNETIALHGVSGDVYVGGGGQVGDLIMRNASTKTTAHLRGSDALLRLGGEKTPGILTVRDNSPGAGKETIRLQGSDGSVLAGGGGQAGRIGVRDAAGTVTASMGGANGAVEARSLHLNIGEGLSFLGEGHYFGTNYDARIIRMVDGNGERGEVDGGIAIEGYTPKDGERRKIMTIRGPWNKRIGEVGIHRSNLNISGGRYRRIKVESDEYWAGIELVVKEEGGGADVNKQGNPYIDFTHGAEHELNYGIRVFAPDNETLRVKANKKPAKLVVEGDLEVTGTLSRLEVAERASASIRAHDLRLGHSSRSNKLGRAFVDNTDALVVNYGNDWPRTEVHSELRVTKGLKVSKSVSVSQNLSVSGALAGIAKTSVPGLAQAKLRMVVGRTNPGDWQKVGKHGIRVTINLGSTFSKLPMVFADIVVGAVLEDVPVLPNAVIQFHLKAAKLDPSKFSVYANVGLLKPGEDITKKGWSVMWMAIGA